MVENTELYQKYWDLAFKDSPVFEQRNWQEKYREVTADFVPVGSSMGNSDQIGYLHEVCDRPEVTEAGLQVPMLRMDRFHDDDYELTSRYGKTISELLSFRNPNYFFVFNYYYIDSGGRMLKVEEIRDSGESANILRSEGLEQARIVPDLLEESTRCVALTAGDEKYLQALLVRMIEGELEVGTYFGVYKIGGRVDEWTMERSNIVDLLPRG